MGSKSLSFRAFSIRQGNGSLHFGNRASAILKGHQNQYFLSLKLFIWAQSLCIIRLIIFWVVTYIHIVSQLNLCAIYALPAIETRFKPAISFPSIANGEER